MRICEVDWSSPATGGAPFTRRPDSERVLEADLAFLALGFVGPDPRIAEQFGLEVDDRSNLRAEYGKHATNVEGVFAAGDCRRGQSLIVWAIAEGRAAARECDRYLAGSTRLP